MKSYGDKELFKLRTSLYQNMPASHHNSKRESKKRTSITDRESDEEIMTRIDSLRRDPEKFERWIASKVEIVIKHWPKH